MIQEYSTILLRYIQLQTELDTQKKPYIMNYDSDRTPRSIQKPIYSKKMSHNKDEKQVDYYPKNQQFKPFRTDYQSPQDDDDIDYPKAS